MSKTNHAYPAAVSAFALAIAMLPAAAVAQAPAPPASGTPAPGEIAGWRSSW